MAILAGTTGLLRATLCCLHAFSILTFGAGRAEMAAVLACIVFANTAFSTVYRFTNVISETFTHSADSTLLWFAVSIDAVIARTARLVSAAFCGGAAAPSHSSLTCGASITGISFILAAGVNNTVAGNNTVMVHALKLTRTLPVLQTA